MASDIRSMLTAQQVAEHYGFEVNRSGFMKCPFHTGDLWKGHFIKPERLTSPP